MISASTIKEIMTSAPPNADVAGLIADAVNEELRVKAELTRLRMELAQHRADFSALEKKYSDQMTNLQTICPHLASEGHIGAESCDNYHDCPNCGKVLSAYLTRRTTSPQMSRIIAPETCVDGARCPHPERCLGGKLCSRP